MAGRPGLEACTLLRVNTCRGNLALAVTGLFYPEPDAVVTLRGPAWTAAGLSPTRIARPIILQLASSTTAIHHGNAGGSRRVQVKRAPWVRAAVMRHAV